MSKQLSLFGRLPSWWSRIDQACVDGWHELQNRLDTYPSIPACYVLLSSETRPACPCGACQRFDADQEQAERLIEAWHAGSRPSCRTCAFWTSQQGEPSGCSLMGSGPMAGDDLCEGWQVRDV